jgi:hypothetical protein
VDYSYVANLLFGECLKALSNEKFDEINARLYSFLSLNSDRSIHYCYLLFLNEKLLITEMEEDVKLPKYGCQRKIKIYLFSFVFIRKILLEKSEVI